MARVVLPRSLESQGEAGAALDVDVRNVRELMRLLEQRMPGVATRLEGMAIAIDGEIIGDPLLEPIEPDSEVHFLPRISGG